MRITEDACYLGRRINTLKAMSDSGKIICHRAGDGMKGLVWKEMERNNAEPVRTGTER